MTQIEIKPLTLLSAAEDSKHVAALVKLIDDKKNNLTDEEKQKQEEVNLEWESRLISKERIPIDIERLQQFVPSLYCLGGYEPPKQILTFNHPHDMLRKARELTANPEFSDFSYYANVSDYGWCSVYDFYIQIGVIQDSVMEHYIQFLKSNIFDSILLDDTALFLSIPTIKFDDRNRIHCDDGPAVEWFDDDGNSTFQIYAWKDVILTKEIILEHDKVTKEMLEEFNSNAEARRCCIEAMGVSNFFNVLGENLAVIDEDIDAHGNPMKLMQFKFEDTMIQVLEVTCPSTKRVYNLYPPKDTNNVFDAKASTFGLTKENFKPVIES